jgi:serine/threonine protein kinase
VTDNGWNGTPGPRSPGSRGWATGARFGDRYLVGRLIGEGGWAETYEGQDLLLGRTVALKVLRTQFAADPALVDRFEREARISASVSHPNVVAVYDYGTQDGSFFIALQYIAGEDLKQAIVRRGRVPISEAIHIIREILRGLGEIHRAGIVHRDVKPQNVLLGQDGLIRITDFGIAHQELATRVTTMGDAIGTASYMAPEQAQGEGVSPATDIYAVGVVLYELLTGRLPFNRGHAMAILLAHIQEQPAPPSVAAPDAGIPPWLDGVVLRAMEKQPSARFPSAAAMIDALTGFGRDDHTAPLSAATVSTAAGATRVISPGIPTRQRNAGGSPPRMPPPVSRAPGGRPQPSRWGRNLARGLALLALLAIAAVAAASMMDDDPYGLWGGDGDADPTPTAQSISPLPTETEEESGEELTPEPTSADEPEEVPSETPVPTIRPLPTVALPLTPTQEPEAPPTETPVPTETPEPATETPVPVEEAPTDVPDPPTEPIDDPDDQQTGGESEGSDSAEILLPANQWSGGAGTRVDEGGGLDESGGPREVIELDTSSDDDAEATATFELSSVPSGGVLIEIEVRLGDADNSPGALSVAVNEADMTQPVDLTGGAGRWSVVEVSVPPGALSTGNNRIVATAIDPSGNADGRATILLGDITIRSDGALEERESTESDPVTVDDGSRPTVDGGAEPTIAPA